MTSALMASGSMARVSRAAIAPQQPGQALARLRLAAPAQQQRQDRFGLARRQGERGPIRAKGGKSAQQVHSNPRHTLL